MYKAQVLRNGEWTDLWAFFRLSEYLAAYYWSHVEYERGIPCRMVKDC